MEVSFKNTKTKTKQIRNKAKTKQNKKTPEVLYVTTKCGSIEEYCISFLEDRSAICNHSDCKGCALPVLETPSCFTSSKYLKSSAAPSTNELVFPGLGRAIKRQNRLLLRAVK